MRIKTDYMGNDQLLPAYNLQAAICDEYIAVVDVKQYASDMECFVPLMEKFNQTYGHYPKYPVADAGYGSYNNYIYCEEHGMEKYMKFTMFKKETTDKKYRNNPYRINNFKRDSDGFLVCPNGKRDLCLNTINIFIKTSMDGQKKYMNVRIAPAVLIAKNVVRKKKETEQQD